MAPTETQVLKTTFQVRYGCTPEYDAAVTKNEVILHGLTGRDLQDLSLNIKSRIVFIVYHHLWGKG